MTYEEKEKILIDNEPFIAKMCYKYYGTLKKCGYTIEDLINEVMLRVWSKLDEYNDMYTITTYIGIIARSKMNNLVTNYSRQKREGEKKSYKIDNLESKETKEKYGYLDKGYIPEGVYHNTKFNTKKAFIEFVMENATPWFLDYYAYNLSWDEIIQKYFIPLQYPANVRAIRRLCQKELKRFKKLYAKEWQILDY